MTQSSDKTIRTSDLYAKMFLPIDLSRNYLFYYGGRAWAKSTANALTICTIMMLDPECETVVMRELSNSHRDSTFKDIQIAASWLGINVKTKLSPLEIIFPNGNKVYFKSMSTLLSTKGNRPEVNKNIGLLWLFEIAEFKNDMAIEQAVSTYSRGGDKKFNVLMEANPPEDEYHWIHDYVEMARNSNEHTLVEKSYLDLTEEEQQKFLGPVMLRTINNMKELYPERYNHIYLGQPLRNTGKCFVKVPEIRELPVDKNGIPVFDFIICGMDYGQQDATTVVAVGVIKDNYYIFDQYYHKGLVTGRLHSFYQNNPYVSQDCGREKPITVYKTEIANWLQNIVDTYTCPITLSMDTSPSAVYTLFSSDTEIPTEVIIKKVNKKKLSTSSKSAVEERIQMINILELQGKLFATDNRFPVMKALAEAKRDRKGNRLDNGTTDIDSCDALEYAILEDASYIINNLYGKGVIE